MWEYRVVWGSPPEWWPAAWSRGRRLAERGIVSLEERTDLYLVVDGRADVGLKLREDDAERPFEVKVRLDRRGGWELWEKVIYRRWNRLEEERLALHLGVETPASVDPPVRTPFEAARALLERAGHSCRDVEIGKTRLQAAAGRWLTGIPGAVPPEHCLAELVEIRFPDRAEPLYSLCLEALVPLPGAVERLPTGGGVCCGYPELLTRPGGGS